MHVMFQNYSKLFAGLVFIQKSYCWTVDLFIRLQIHKNVSRLRESSFLSKAKSDSALITISPSRRIGCGVEKEGTLVFVDMGVLFLQRQCQITALWMDFYGQINRIFLRCEHMVEQSMTSSQGKECHFLMNSGQTVPSQTDSSSDRKYFRQTALQTDSSSDRQFVRQTALQTDSSSDRQYHRQTARQTDSSSDRLLVRQTARQRDNSSDRQLFRQTAPQTESS